MTTSAGVLRYLTGANPTVPVGDPDGDGEWVAQSLEHPGITARGDSPRGALANLNTAIDATTSGDVS